MNTTAVEGNTAPNLDDLLADRFGFNDFQPGQRDVIQHLLDSRSAAAVFPTGGGKSLCYQLPSLILPGITLVVSPLIALMKDQIDALTARGIDAVRLDSTLDADEYRAVLQRLREKRLKLLYVSPERFKNERFRNLVEQLHISLFAVDEAHCISEWGHNFRPDYLKLARFAELCKAERTLALTATAPPAVLDDICREFAIDPECAIRTGFYRENLTLLATAVSTDERDNVLLSRLRERPAGATIVYVTLQKTAERVAATLANEAMPARAYHAGMDAETRADVQEWFLGSSDGIIVATIAFGMGIDKPNIRYIYHYNLAKSLENYSQEIGRAGRDGFEAICEALVCLDDLRTLENFVYGDTPTAAAVLSFVADVLSRGLDFGVSVYELAYTHDIRDLVVRTLLTYLELEGYLEGGTPFYAEYRFCPHVSSGEILGRFDGERREFLSQVLRCARKRKKWFTIDIDAAASSTGSDRQRVVRAIDYLGELGLMEVQVSGVREQYRRLREPDNLTELSDSLHQRTLRRQQRELERLRQIVDLMKLDGCLVSALGAHFGEPLDASCGHCSWCRSGGKPLTLILPRMVEIDANVWQQAEQLRGEQPDALDEPRAMARFLCGVSSPVLIRSKLTRHSLFGALAGVSFDEILRRSSTLVRSE